MFRDSRVADVQRTASSFREGCRKYAASREEWFDGSPGAVDRRVVATERLLHAARQTVARFPVSQAAPYLKAARQLEADLASLQNLRDALITGANDYEELGPPGHKTAHWAQDAEQGGFIFPGHGPDPHDYSSHQEWSQAYKLNDWINQSRQMSSPARPGEFDHSIGDYAVPSMSQDMTGGDQYQTPSVSMEDPRSQSNSANYPKAYTPGNPMATHGPPVEGAPVQPHGPVQQGDPNFHSPRESVPPTYRPPAATPHLPAGQEHNWSNPNTQKYQGKPPASVLGSLSRDDARWVALESHRFLASNDDAMDDSRELAIRAHNHASVKTSTYSPDYSDAVCRAFVGAVVEAGRSTYRPPARPRVAAINYDAIPAEAMFL